MSIRLLKDNVYLPSELIDNWPLYGGFSDDLYENTIPALDSAHYIRSYLIEKCIGGGCQHGRYKQVPVKPGLTVDCLY